MSANNRTPMTAVKTKSEGRRCPTNDSQEQTGIIPRAN